MNNINCGFFNSNEDGDRTYDANDMSQMMNGMVTGGVFPNVGNKFNITVSGTSLQIDTGKAWWHGKWFENLAIHSIDDGASSENDRIDLLVMEVNENEEVRDCYFKIVKGMPGNPPESPVPVNSDGIYQLPLARILREAEDVSIKSENVTVLIGTNESPWAETALDPNKALYAYEDDVHEEVDADFLVYGQKGVKNVSMFIFPPDDSPYAIADVTFDKPFKEGVTPTILHSTDTVAYIEDISISNITNSGFRITIRLNSNYQAASYNVSWFAMI